MPDEHEVEECYQSLRLRLNRTLNWTRQQGVDVFYDPVKLDEKVYQIARRSQRERRA